MVTGSTDRRASDDSRDRLIRLEENLKHIDNTLREIKDFIEKQSITHAQDVKLVDLRVNTLEKRVDKLYWIWGSITFVGGGIGAGLVEFILHYVTK